MHSMSLQKSLSKWRLSSPQLPYPPVPALTPGKPCCLKDGTIKKRMADGSGVSGGEVQQRPLLEARGRLPVSAEITYAKSHIRRAFCRFAGCILRSWLAASTRAVSSPTCSKSAALSSACLTETHKRSATVGQAWCQSDPDGG